MLNYFKFATAACLAFLLASLSGCAIPGTFSGGGTIPNKASTNGKATFTFSGDNCSGYIVGSVNYVGHEAMPGTVKLNSVELENTGECVSPEDSNYAVAACTLCNGLNLLSQAGDGPVYASEFRYISTNPTIPGEGEAFICVQDNGQGSKASGPDYGVISVTSGPYSGYLKFGPLKGNASSGACPIL